MHVAVAKADVVLASAPPYPAFQVRGQGIDDRDANAVQSAGELIASFGELAASMEPRQDQLDTADLLLRMDVDRHAPAVIDHLEQIGRASCRKEWRSR